MELKDFQRLKKQKEGALNMINFKLCQYSSPLKKRFWGYAGYFADPDGQHWEIVWNPA